MKKRIFRRFVLFMMVCALVMVGVRPVLAAKVAEKYALEFGTLKGELFDGIAEANPDLYEFSYRTSITNRIYSTTTLRNTVQICKYSTGVTLDREQFSEVGVTSIGSYFQLDHISGYKNTKFKVFGSHEVIPPAAATGSTSHVAYTSNVYYYQDDLV